ncbi:hypothetical protein HPB51_020383 [Rhipicephalus microplus]|uniref:Transposable element n=1 Tax=Rhipicephalus microplus TaxID=6941 RepID=A0A9J6DW37_RHIMP|nr:hypothetical protein HPB51_020383 [Rhipicephalus microplus]
MEVASRLRGISQLKIRGQIHAFHAYVADPEGVLRGIVHGIPAGTSQDELIENLRVRTQGVNIERARMLGSSKTAIITFTGNVLPRSVYIMGAGLICYPYKPTVQVCKICLQTEHRTDVCPTLNVNVCLKCAAREPMQGHDCIPKCVICDGEHPTGDSLCKKKLKNVAPPKKSRTDQPKDWASQTECTGDAKSSEEFPPLRLDMPPWFSSDRIDKRQSRSSSRSRSRSQSRLRSRSRSKRDRQHHTNMAPPAPGKSSLKSQQKHSGPPAEMGSCEESQDALAAGRTNINQVSFAGAVSSNAPITENPQYKKILEENKRLTKEVEQLKKQMAEERNNLQAAICSLERRLEAKLRPQNPTGIAGECCRKTTYQQSIKPPFRGAVRRRLKLRKGWCTQVCEHHFLESDFVDSTSYTDSMTGKVIEVPLKLRRLKPSAIPSVFPNCPAYLSRQETSARESPEEKRARVDAEALQEAIRLSEQSHEAEEKKNAIATFEDLLTAVGDLSLTDFWTKVVTQQQVLFLNFSDQGAPVVHRAVTVASDLSLAVYVGEMRLQNLGSSVLPMTISDLRVLHKVLCDLEPSLRTTNFADYTADSLRTLALTSVSSCSVTTGRTFADYTAEFLRALALTLRLLLISRLGCSVKYLARDFPDLSRHFVGAIRSEGWGEARRFVCPPRRMTQLGLTPPRSFEKNRGLAGPPMWGEEDRLRSRASAGRARAREPWMFAFFFFSFYLAAFLPPVVARIWRRALV